MQSESQSTGSGALGAEELTRLRAGDDRLLAELFGRHRERLWRMVQFRMHPRLGARVDADDVLQEAYLSAAQRISHYLEDPTRSFFVWLRLIVGQTLIDVHRRHLGAEMRNASREVSASRQYPQATSVALAAEFLGSITSPSQAAQKAELTQQLEAAIAAMSPMDQEIIALRHFEDLTNLEVAELLGIQPTAASNRYVRAIGKLREILVRVPGFFDQNSRGGGDVT